MGGVARRATVLKEYSLKHPELPMLVVETGNALKQSDDLDNPASRWVVEALNSLGSHAVNTTVADLRRLNRIAEMGKIPGELRTPYIATMAEALSARHFPIKRYSVQSLRAPHGDQVVRIGILAVSPVTRDAAQVAKMMDVDEALRQFLPEVDHQSDLVVLLSRLSDSELTRVAGLFPAIDVIINGSSKGEGREFPKSGDTVMVEAAHGGIALGVLDLEWDEKGRIRKSANQMIPLPPMVQDNREIALIAAKAHKEASEFMEAEARKAPPVTMPSMYAGAQDCKVCHEKAFKVWQKSGHARAIETLKKTSDQFNSDCLLCHVTGLGDNRGFVNVIRTPELANVQCEACHTAAKQHASKPQEYHPGSEIGINFRRPVKKEFCIRCHTRENSPRFNYDDYWKKIAH